MSSKTFRNQIYTHLVFSYFDGNDDADDTTLMAESEEELKSLLMKFKEESENVDLKFSIQKLRSWHLVPALYGKILPYDFFFHINV